MSFSNTFSSVIFGLPLPLLPSTVISILFFTQSFPSFLNTCPIHLSLLCLITSLIFSMPILSFSICLLSQWHSIYLSCHSHFSSLKFCFLLSFHCPYFHILLNFKHMPHRLSLSTSMPPCQNTWQLPKLFPAISYSWNWCQTWSSSIQYITQVAEFADSYNFSILQFQIFHPFSLTSDPFILQGYSASKTLNSHYIKNIVCYWKNNFIFCIPVNSFK